MSSVSCLRCFQNLSEIISGWLALEEERFWARPTSTKVGTELAKVGTELQVVANNLRSLEVSEEKANEREKCDKALVTTLTAKLKQAESRAQFAEKSVQKLQKEVSFPLLDAAAVTEFFRWTSWTIVSWKNN